MDSSADTRVSLPLSRQDVFAELKHREAELRQLGIERLFLFGSIARNEASSTSDIDLFFDYRPGEFGVFELMEIKARLSNIHGRPVDIMTRDSIHKTLRQRIEAAAIPVF